MINEYRNEKSDARIKRKYEAYKSEEELSSYNKKDIEPVSKENDHKLKKQQNLASTDHNLKPCSVVLIKTNYIDAMAEKLRSKSRNIDDKISCENTDIHSNYADLNYKRIKSRAQSSSERKYLNSECSEVNKRKNVNEDNKKNSSSSDDVFSSSDDVFSSSDESEAEPNKNHMFNIEFKNDETRPCGSHTNRNNDVVPQNIYELRRAEFARCFLDKVQELIDKHPNHFNQDSDDNSLVDNCDRTYVFRSQVSKKYAVDYFEFENTGKLYITVDLREKTNSSEEHAKCEQNKENGPITITETLKPFETFNNKNNEIVSRNPFTCCDHSSSAGSEVIKCVLNDMLSKTEDCTSPNSYSELDSDKRDVRKSEKGFIVDSEKEIAAESEEEVIVESDQEVTAESEQKVTAESEEEAVSLL